MEKKPRDQQTSSTRETKREMEAKRRLARPPKDKSEVTIAPSVRGPDVSIG
ncbi:MAG TPA: hypothetical protein VF773_15800 [Verrucomicrobiae bacterium]